MKGLPVISFDAVTIGSTLTLIFADTGQQHQQETYRMLRDVRLHSQLMGQEMPAQMPKQQS